MTQLDSAFLTWEIKNFTNLTEMQTSPDLVTKQTLFWLRLYPNDKLQNMTKHIIIYLMRYEPHLSYLKVLCTISLINDKGEECYSNVFKVNYSVNSKFEPNDGGLYHLNRNTILEPSSGLLPGGKLTVKCTVTIMEDQDSVNIEDKKITLAQKKALGNYETLLENSKLSDVAFVVGKKEFKLHKTVLASQSPVFSAMFENDLEEAKQNRVEITDVDVDVFEVMIRFIYTANVDSVQRYALDLLVAADKYQLDSLKDICVDYLGSNLTIESVANILLVADMHSESELKSKCIEFINNKNTTKVFATEGWKLLVKSRHQLGLELYYDIANKFEIK